MSNINTSFVLKRAEVGIINGTLVNNDYHSLKQIKVEPIFSVDQEFPDVVKWIVILPTIRLNGSILDKPRADMVSEVSIIVNDTLDELIEMQRKVLAD